ncbi:MAG: hypothetical protein RIS47_2012 [Bacteroidota bacterium]|jgi:hypothetical protein
MARTFGFALGSNAYPHLRWLKTQANAAKRFGVDWH